MTETDPIYIEDEHQHSGLISVLYPADRERFESNFVTSD